MASKRNAKFLDAQNFIYELRQKWYQTEGQMEHHKAENGKDTMYYILLGRCDALMQAVDMAEEFAAGQYAVKYD